MNNFEKFSKHAVTKEEAKNIKGGFPISYEMMCNVFYGATYLALEAGDKDGASAAWAAYNNACCNGCL